MNFELIKLIAFDVDGTLFSSEEIILDTYIESIKNFKQKYKNENLSIPSKEEIINLVGLPVKTIFKNLLPELNEDQRDEISNSVLGFLTEKINSKQGILYKQVFETISYLHSKKYIIVAASNGRHKYIHSILNTYNLLPFFEEIITIDYTKIKDKNEILESYIHKYNLNSSEVLMIGDRDSDYNAAKKNNTPFAFCKYGHAKENEIKDFDILLEDISDLKKHF